MAFRNISMFLWAMVEIVWEVFLFCHSLWNVRYLKDFFCVLFLKDGWSQGHLKDKLQTYFNVILLKKRHLLCPPLGRWYAELFIRLMVQLCSQFLCLSKGYFSHQHFWGNGVDGFYVVMSRLISSGHYYMIICRVCSCFWVQPFPIIIWNSLFLWNWTCMLCYILSYAWLMYN